MATAPGLHIPYVAGELKGNSKTISNLLLAQNTSNLGFVGSLRNTSAQATAALKLADLTVSGSITGIGNLGLAAGSSWLRGLNSVSTSGSVSGTDLYYYSAPEYDDRGENNNTEARNGYSQVGGVLGYAWGSSGTLLPLTVVQSSATVTGVNSVGGVAGRLIYAAVSSTTSTGAVTSVATADVTDPRRTGGVVGYLEQSVSYIQNSSHTDGLVKGYRWVGGLVGHTGSSGP
jgi:hypothetical protein